MVIDLADPSTFAEAREWIDKHFGKLDVLINNAGGAEDVDWQSDATNLPVDVLRRTFELNFFSLVELTQVLLPLLRKSDHPRIVNQSSILGSLGEHSDPASTIAGVNALAYDASKTAVNAFTVHLAKVLRDTLFQGEFRPSRQRQNRPQSDRRSDRRRRRAHRRGTRHHPR